ncbi:MAG: type II toxin-antitoxin system VapC family toxin, partial [Chloroflexota bacterium]|nr:type II toxin-antitoxin system VapC family toxin [Chloroflexota bacterium]
MTALVLDSFALLAHFLGEAAGSHVRDILREANKGNIRLILNTANLAEIAYRLERTWGEDRMTEVLALIDSYPIELVDIDRELALAAAHLKAQHRVSLADCFAAALAQRLDAAVLTGDPDFQRL